VAELVYAADLKSVASRLEGSSPSSPTKKYILLSSGVYFCVAIVSGAATRQEQFDKNWLCRDFSYYARVA
jgi:hypothetical protein